MWAILALLSGFGWYGGGLVGLAVPELARARLALPDLPERAQLQLLDRGERLVRPEARRVADVTAVVGRPQPAPRLGDMLIRDRRAARDRADPDQRPARLAGLGVDVQSGELAEGPSL